ncbi:hypothetical protein Leryth_016735 [Lithospermum erythrorhizon]|nr:hypothetical protein Leryth_016735 [Lithospermum erythrorhizon]
MVKILVVAAFHLIMTEEILLIPHIELGNENWSAVVTVIENMPTLTDIMGIVILAENLKKTDSPYGPGTVQRFTFIDMERRDVCWPLKHFFLYCRPTCCRCCPAEILVYDSVRN